MATATRTEQAGVFVLDSLNEYLVYVPPQCVGPHRCPLLVSLHGAGFTASAALPWHRGSADKAGVILLEPTGVGSSWDEESEEENRTNLDAAIK